MRAVGRAHFSRKNLDAVTHMHACTQAVCHCARIIVQSTAPAKIAKVKDILKIVKKKSVEDEFAEGLLFVLQCMYACQRTYFG